MKSKLSKLCKLLLLKRDKQNKLSVSKATSAYFLIKGIRETLIR